MAKTYTAASTATAGQVYTASAHNTIVTDVNNLIVPPACRLVRTTDQSIPSTTDTIISMGSAEYDTDGMATTGASARITINTTGLYSVTVEARYASVTATFIRAVFVTKNSGTGTRLIYVTLSPTDGATYLSGSTVVALSATDYLTPYAYHSRAASAAISISADGAYAASLTATWIGRTS